MSKSQQTFVSQALASFESALKSKEGPLFPIQAEVAMLRSRYESERRKWDESLEISRHHKLLLEGDDNDRDKKPGLLWCMRTIRQTLAEHVEMTRKREEERLARQAHLKKVFWSTFIVALVTLAIQALWIMAKLPVIKP